LEAFFGKLRDLDTLPKDTPQKLSELSRQIDELQAHSAGSLAPAQLQLLAQKRQELEKIRQERIQQTQKWLKTIAMRYKEGASPNELLEELKRSPHLAFLSKEKQQLLEQVKSGLQKKIDQDKYSQIKILFNQLSPPMRRKCLQELQRLLEE